MKVELKDYVVEIKEELSFGDMEDIQEALGDGSQEKLLQGNAKLIEIAIVKIEDKEGKEQKYTEEWRRNLPLRDGLKLSQDVQVLTSGIEELVKKD